MAESVSKVLEAQAVAQGGPDGMCGLSLGQEDAMHRLGGVELGQDPRILPLTGMGMGWIYLTLPVPTPPAWVAGYLPG